MTLSHFAAQFRDNHVHQVEYHRAFWGSFCKLQKWRVPQLEDYETAVRDWTTCTQIAQVILMHGMAIVGGYIIMYAQKVRDLYDIHEQAINRMRDNMRLTFQRHRVDRLRVILDAFSRKCSR
jgi:hypothetical protein